jgi:amino acid transporter
MKAQDIPLSALPWIAPFQPYISWAGFVIAIILVLISGWTSFLSPFGES